MPDAYCTILEQEALLHISGPDTLKFLQGQTTCDTTEIDETHALSGAYCNPQGRMVCDFLLCQLGEDHYAMRMRGDIVKLSATTFSKYIIFSKATLEPDNSDWQTMACWGSTVREVLNTIFPSVPSEQRGAIMGDDFVLVQIDDAGCQYECYLNTRTQPDLPDRLGGAMSAGSESTWQTLQIASGIGRIEAPTVEAFIPQMLNYDITGHVNFKKGCYTGQEVVARMHYRGKSKRRMYRSEAPSAEAPAAGTTLLASGSEQGVGNVVNSALNESGSAVMLVVATEAGVEKGLHLGANDGPLLKMDVLPYLMEKP